MKKVLLWFFLSCKRYLKRLSFLVILLLFPLGSMAFQRAEQGGGQEIRIAVFAENPRENALGSRLAGDLTAYGGAEGMFHFYLCGSPEQVKSDVAARRAECGYVIYDDLEKKLDTKKYKRCIGVVTAPSTVTAQLSTEIVFSLLMEHYDRSLLTGYVAENQLFEPLDAQDRRAGAVEEAGKLYDEYQDNGSTFSFEYKVMASSENAKPRESSLLPVRGLMAVYVFITGLYGAVTLCQDEKRGLFQPLSHRLALPCRIASLAAPVALSMAGGLLALWLSGTLGSPGREIVLLLGYGAAVTAFAGLLKWIFRSEAVLCCLIPFFIIGSLIFCPVFLDTSRLLPELGKLGRLFLPYYYLRLF